MAGYAVRNHPAEGKATDLWLKALALEDARGRRAVIVTLDVVGLKRPIYVHVSQTLREKFGLRPEQFLLCSSHTHSGPLLRGSSRDNYPIDDQQTALVEAYSDELETRLAETVGRALADLAPARLAAGQGHAGFAVNRRNNNETNTEALISDGALKGPVDHSVPVLVVYWPDGTLKAVLFGYACHNTTMDFYQWCADYAGFAQAALERSHPEATALFFMGCGGDQNPLPRRRLELAECYGQMLAAAVEETLRTSPTPLPPKLVTAMETIPLEFGPPPTKAELHAFTNDPTPAIRRWATRLLGELDAGNPFIHSWPYPVHAWRFGDRQLLIALAGEPVVDYALKFKRQFGPQTWVAGYCDEVMTYIPSRRVLDEDKPPLASPGWGYEGSRALMAAGVPAFRWSNNVEVSIARVVERLVRETR
jgi:hypothetical protein